MSITLYWISGSAPAWRTLLFLEFKGLEYQSRILQTSNKEQKEPWFLKINPRGQIPVLQDGDLTIVESQAIMRYLEKRYPSPALFGNSLEETTDIEQTTQEILNYTEAAVSEFVQPVFRGRIDQCRERLPDIAEGIHAELKIVEDGFEQSAGNPGPGICGNYSAADVALIPTIQRLLRAANKAPEIADEYGLRDLQSRYSKLYEWNTAIESLDAFQNSFPPHWRDS